MLSFTACPDESGKSGLSATKVGFAGKKLEYWKYYLTIVSLVLVSIQTQAQNNGWKHITDQPTPSAAASACVINDKIYVIGGSDGAPNFNDMDANDMYDPSTDTWDTTLAPMPTPRAWLSSAVVDGIIYAIGGGYPTATKKNEAYNPLTDTWDTTKADLLSPRRGAHAGVVDGIIYNIGGNQSERNCEAYDPVTNTWTSKTEMPGGGGDLAVTVYNGLIYTFGGGYYTVGPYSNVYAYNPQTDTWDTTLTPMPTARFGLETYLVGDTIYAIGGSQSQGTTLATVEAYYPLTDTWDTLANMPVNLIWFAGAVVNDKIYVIGGTPNWLTGNGWVWEYIPPVVDVEQEFTPPIEFALSQNYPNPFNPSTKISWQLPEGSDVTLKIFNTIGEEVVTLVNNEYQNAGEHSSLFIVNSTLPSGVYFYQLRAGSFLETKKMLLLK